MCQAGQYTNSDGSIHCLECEPGKFGTEDDENCIHCAEDEYSDEYGSTGCKICDPPLRAKEGSSKCIEDCRCTAGDYDDVKQNFTSKVCPAGRICPENAINDSATCDLHDDNEYCAVRFESGKKVLWTASFNRGQIEACGAGQECAKCFPDGDLDLALLIESRYFSSKCGRWEEGRSGTKSCVESLSK